MEDKKKKSKIPVLIVVTFLVLVISLKLFLTMDSSYDSNNIYYIFSTSAQTLAALVGFVLTAYIFTHQNLRNIKENDETLAEIIDDTIDKYYKFIFYLSIYTAIVLISDLLMLQLNKVENLQIKPISFVIVAMINVIGIIFAFAIALYIMRPFKPNQWAKSILENETHNTDINIDYEEDNTIKARNFIEAFIKLEQLINRFTNKEYGLDLSVALRKKIDYLHLDEQISREDLNDLLVITKYRNLVVHGQVNVIEKEVYNNLVKLLEELERKLKVND